MRQQNGVTAGETALIQCPSRNNTATDARAHGVPVGAIQRSGRSTWKNEHLERAAALMAACGLTLRPITERTLPEDHLAALETLARIALRNGSGA